MRNLHTRIFRAFSTLGFEDHWWMSTQDLTWLLSRGRQEVLEAEAALQGARTALSAAAAQGIRHETERKKMETAITKAQATLDDLKHQLVPYEAEWESRQRPMQA